MKGTMKKWMALVTAVILAISLFAIPAFAETTAATTPATSAGNTTGTNNAPQTPAKEGLTTGQIVGIIIAAVVLVVLIVLCIKFREKLQKFFRVYKSETKKIVWLPWNQTLKSSYVVAVMLIICAVAICLLDIGLSTGFKAFIKLF